MDTSQYSEARSSVDELRRLNNEAVSLFNDVESAFNSVDKAALEDGGIVAYQNEVTDWLEEQSEWHDLMELFIDAMEPFLDGAVTFFSGVEAYENEDYQTASDKFGDAQVDFAESERIFQRLQDRGAEFPSIEADLIRLVCFAGALSDASGYMKDAVDAYQSGNYTEANEAAQRASDAANRCGS